MAYGELGLDILQTLKTVGKEVGEAAKSVVLNKAGTAIATSPQGQAAIKQSLLEQGQAKAVTIFQDAKPYLPYVGAAFAAYLFLPKLFGRRGRR